MISTSDSNVIVLLPAGPGRWVRIKRINKRRAFPNMTAEVVEYWRGSRRARNMAVIAKPSVKRGKRVPDSAALAWLRELAAQMRGE